MLYHTKRTKGWHSGRHTGACCVCGDCCQANAQGDFHDASLKTRGREGQPEDDDDDDDDFRGCTGNHNSTRAYRAQKTQASYVHTHIYYFCIFVSTLFSLCTAEGGYGARAIGDAR